MRLIDPRLIFPRGASGDALVSGTPASGGTVTATVKVIRETADFAAFTDGGVLVCPYTNPSWTPLFQRAAAVVVDAGGPGSHAAIYQATLDELAEVGYAKLTMERVAERAKTGKAALYRRWSSRMELLDSHPLRAAADEVRREIGTLPTPAAMVARLVQFADDSHRRPPPG